MKIQPFEGNPKFRWAIDVYGWPLGPGALRVTLQEKRWWGWRNVESQYAYGPGDVEYAKHVILMTPKIEADRKAEEARKKKIADDYLNR